MKQICRFSALACVFTIALATQSFAQGKIKVAIWEFDNNAAHSYWYWDKMGPAARNIIDTAFSENKLLANKFSVIERDKLNLVLKEQGLAQTGAVDPTTAARAGSSSISRTFPPSARPTTRAWPCRPTMRIFCTFRR